MDSFQRDVKRYGLPLALYTDKQTTYKSPAEPTVEEQLAGRKPQSQFERSLAELGVAAIHAHSPQAKGRIERLFKTLQGRLIKELRLASSVTITAANRFWATWLPRDNRRFGVHPTQATDLHRPRPAARERDRVLCLKTTRGVRRDWMVAYHGYLYQLETNVRTTQVVVEERLDGTIAITHHDRPLRSHALTSRPVRGMAPTPLAPPRRPVKPKPTHPWHRRFVPEHHKPAEIAMT